MLALVRLRQKVINLNCGGTCYQDTNDTKEVFSSKNTTPCGNKFAGNKIKFINRVFKIVRLSNDNIWQLTLLSSTGLCSD